MSKCIYIKGTIGFRRAGSLRLKAYKAADFLTGLCLPVLRTGIKVIFEFPEEFYLMMEEENNEKGNGSCGGAGSTFGSYGL
jgi:hypothetical protein